MTEAERLLWNYASAIRASVSCGSGNEFTNKQLEEAIKELAAALDASKLGKEQAHG